MTLLLPLEPESLFLVVVVVDRADRSDFSRKRFKSIPIHSCSDCGFRCGETQENRGVFRSGVHVVRASVFHPQPFPQLYRNCFVSISTVRATCWSSWMS